MSLEIDAEVRAFLAIPSGDHIERIPSADNTAILPPCSARRPRAFRRTIIGQQATRNPDIERVLRKLDNSVYTSVSFHCIPFRLLKPPRENVAFRLLRGDLRRFITGSLAFIVSTGLAMAAHTAVFRVPDGSGARI